MKNLICILLLLLSHNLLSQNWFPLNLENQWLLLKERTNWNNAFYHYDYLNIKVIADSVIDGKTYYRIINFLDYDSTALFRYNQTERTIYARISGAENIIINFNTPIDSTFYQIAPSGQNRQAQMVGFNLNILGTSYYAVGFSTGTKKICFIENIGICYMHIIESVYYYITQESNLIDYKVLGVSPNKYKPQTDITLDQFPIGSTLNHTNISGTINVSHPYSKGDPGSPYSTNFIDSCWVEWFYRKQDSIINLKKELCSIIDNSKIECNSSQFDFSLLENNYLIYYRIIIRNKYFEDNMEYNPNEEFMVLTYPPKFFSHYNVGNYWEFDEYYQSKGLMDSTFLGSYTYLIEKDTILINHKTYHKIIYKKNIAEYLRIPINDCRLIRTDGYCNEHVIDNANLCLYDSLQSSWFGRNHPVVLFSFGFDSSFNFSSNFRVFHSLILPNSYYVLKDSIGLIYLRQALNVSPYDEFKTTILRKAYINGKTYLNTLSNFEQNSFNYSFSLSQNYPNPFNPTTTIRYSLPSPLEGEGQGVRSVRLVVYDVLGREVATLVDEEQAPGNYEVTFNSQQTTNGRQLASGVYLYKINCGSFAQTKKFVLMK